MNKNMLDGLMRQAKQMQDSMQREQEAFAKQEFNGQSGAGMVKVVITGNYDVRRVTIDPDALTEGKEFLEDLIAAAMNDGVQAVRREQSKMGDKMSGGMAGMLPPGMNLGGLFK